MVFVLRVDSVAANFMETLIAQHLVSAFEMCHMHSGAVWSFVQSTRLPKIVLTFPLLPTQHSLSSAHKHTPEPGTVCNECTQWKTTTSTNSTNAPEEKLKNICLPLFIRQTRKMEQKLRKKFRIG